MEAENLGSSTEGSRAEPAFVVLEGVDRCGKTSQAELLAQRIRDGGAPARTFGTPDRRLRTGHLAGKLLRGQVRLAGEVVPDGDALVLQCVLTCNRYAVAAQVRETLRSGTSVVCVRWWPSAVVYGQADGLLRYLVLEASSFLPEPDLFVLLDVDPASIARRFDPAERYEADLDLQRKLADSYRYIWRAESAACPAKWVVVDGSQSESAVADLVWQAYESLRRTERGSGGSQDRGG